MQGFSEKGGPVFLRKIHPGNNMHSFSFNYLIILQCKP